jgi:hypothetical protein
MSLYAQISEKMFTAQVIQLARWHKWRVAHFRPAMTKRGRWVTAVQGDGAGFPDLVLARNGRLIFAELKSAKGKLTKEQIQWAVAIEPGAAFFVWRPADLDRIEEVLKLG